MVALIVKNDPKSLDWLRNDLLEWGYFVAIVYENVEAVPDLLAACEALSASAYRRPYVDLSKWACNLCNVMDTTIERIDHDDWCPVPLAEAAIAKAKREL